MGYALFGPVPARGHVCSCSKPRRRRAGLCASAARRVGLRTWACVVALLLVGSILAARPRAQTVAEPALKAAFLFNFAKFTDWPEDLLAPTAPIVLCVTDAEVGSALESTVSGRTINQHPLTVNRVNLDAVRTCTILYAGKLDRHKTSQLAARLAGSNVLTVGDDQAFAASGGMIGLFEDDGRMRFAVNLVAVERTRLRLSAKLLTLAKIVKD